MKLSKKQTAFCNRVAPRWARDEGLAADWLPHDASEAAGGMVQAYCVLIEPLDVRSYRSMRGFLSDLLIKAVDEIETEQREVAKNESKKQRYRIPDL